MARPIRSNCAVGRCHCLCSIPRCKVARFEWNATWSIHFADGAKKFYEFGAFGLPQAEDFALAGGAALIVHGAIDRSTRDLDFFGLLPDTVDLLAPAAERAPRRAGPYASLRVQGSGDGIYQVFGGNGLLQIFADPLVETLPKVGVDVISRNHHDPWRRSFRAQIFDNRDTVSFGHGHVKCNNIE